MTGKSNYPLQMRNILNKFATDSNNCLGCNLEKTSLIQVGSSDPIEENILQLGFEIKNDIVLLGTTITNRSPCFEENCEKIIQKIKKQTLFWKRFNLSIQGS